MQLVTQNIKIVYDFFPCSEKQENLFLLFTVSYTY